MRPRATPSPRPAPGVRRPPYQGGADYGAWRRSTAQYMNTVVSYDGLEQVK